MRAFLIGTAIALALVAFALFAARPAHAAGAATTTTAAATADSSGGVQSTFQAAVQTNASGDQAGWVQYGVFALAFGAMVVIGTGLVPRRRS
jgi:hypothetical protein